MIFDLHIHTYIGSHDSNVYYEDLVPWAKHAGLDAICLTEHGYQKTGVAERLSRDYNFLILEGIEIASSAGDMLVFGIDGIPKEVVKHGITDIGELRSYVVEGGGVMFAAHPFRDDVSRPIEGGIVPGVDLDTVIQRPVFKMVDGIEIANGWSAPEEVDFCKLVCQRMKLKGIGGSDAHLACQIGDCVTIFGNGIHCEADLINELKNGNFHAEDRRQHSPREPNAWLDSQFTACEQLTRQEPP